MTFGTSDGVALHGLQFGAGRVGVVLAHQTGTDGRSWQPLATALAAAGYLVVALDFRSFGQSEGQFSPPGLPTDVAAAAEYLISQGAEEIVVIGASMGGIASLDAVASGLVDPVAIVTLSAPHIWQGLEVTDDELRGIDAPGLIINTEGDEFVLSTRRMVRELPDAEEQLYAGRGHGTDLLSGDLANALVARIVEFVQAHAPTTRSP